MPFLGSLAKGVLKLAIRKVPKLDDVFAVLNYFGKGNAMAWLKTFVAKLPTEHADAAIVEMTALLNRASGWLKTARDSWWSPVTDAMAQPILDSLDRIKALVPTKLREAAETLAERLQ